MAVEKLIEAKETLHAEETPVRVTKGAPAKVFFAVVVPTSPQPVSSASVGLTQEGFEGILDKVSRPLKGRFAHLPYSSEQFIEEKRKEVELEDR